MLFEISDYVCITRRRVGHLICEGASEIPVTLLYATHVSNGRSLSFYKR